MRNILKATLVGLGLIVGAGAVAQAQSVSSLPPNAPPPYAADQGQTPYTTPFHSTQGFYPKPGGSEVIDEGTSQAPPTASQSQANQPYRAGPKLN